jgi:hypothetical protein
MMGYGGWGMGEWGLFGGLTGLVVFIDLVFLDLWLAKQLRK